MLSDGSDNHYVWAAADSDHDETAKHLGLLGHYHASILNTKNLTHENYKQKHAKEHMGSTALYNEKASIMISIAKLEQMLKAELAVDVAFAAMSDKEKELYKATATGVKESCVYGGPEGKIHKQEMLSGDQYFVSHKMKRKYFGSHRGAMSFLKKRHAAKQTTTASYKVENSILQNKFHNVLTKHGYKPSGEMYKIKDHTVQCYKHPNRDDKINIITDKYGTPTTWQHQINNEIHKGYGNSHLDNHLHKIRY